MHGQSTSTQPRRSIARRHRFGVKCWSAMRPGLGSAIVEAIGKMRGMTLRTPDIRRRTAGDYRIGDARAEIARVAGTAPDSTVAAQFGVLARDVAELRRQLGVPAYRRKAWSVIDASLGCVPDAEVGRSLGIGESTIRARRKARGIVSSRAHRSVWSVELDRVLAGPLSDAALAAAYGLAEGQVFERRELLGVGHGGDWRAQEWTKEMDCALGSMPDEQAAALLGVCRRAVRWRRRELQIGAYKPANEGDCRLANSHAA